MLVNNPEPRHKADDKVWPSDKTTNAGKPITVIKSETRYEHRYLVELKDGTRTWVDETLLGDKAKY